MATNSGLIVIQILHRGTQISSEKAQISGANRDRLSTRRNSVPLGPAQRRFSLGLKSRVRHMYQEHDLLHAGHPPAIDSHSGIP
jgi:hypothetical protein